MVPAVTVTGNAVAEKEPATSSSPPKEALDVRVKLKSAVGAVDTQAFPITERMPFRCTRHLSPDRSPSETLNRITRLVS